MIKIKGCGGIIIENEKVLLMKRKNAKFFNEVWSNPGGKVEEGESIEEGVIRELKEEMGIDIKIKRKIGEYEWNQEEYEGIFTGYEVEIESGRPNIMEPHKCSEIGWFELNKLPRPIADYTAYYLEKMGY